MNPLEVDAAGDVGRVEVLDGGLVEAAIAGAVVIAAAAIAPASEDRNLFGEADPIAARAASVGRGGSTRRSFGRSVTGSGGSSAARRSSAIWIRT